jgi:hypothetical protein
MDNTTLLAIAGVGLIIWGAILYIIIRSATSSKFSLKLQRMQVELLQEIALKNGVDTKRIQEIIQYHNK